MTDTERGRAMYALVRELFPICRSITGQGVRQTLEVLSRHIDLRVSEIPSGTEVLDWTVPNEWNIRGGYIANVRGERIIDFDRSNLHVLSYSTPIRRRVSRAELDAHLYSLPDKPDWVPYRTSYYSDNWGFCLSQRQRDSLTDSEYDVCIDSTLAPGHLTLAEGVIPGQTSDEILFTAHLCHPSLCNDNLSGIAIATFLLRELAKTNSRYTIRVLFIPGTIGSICWLSRNRERTASIKHGLSLVCLGDASPFTYKRTLHGNRDIDRAISHALAQSGHPHEVIDYFPYGYDERQFNSLGFGLPVGSLMRARHGQFPEYHTSADNLDFVSAARLEESLAVCLAAVDILNHDGRYRNLRPYAEPQLGKRGVYRQLGGPVLPDTQLAVLWVLALSDGQHSLLSIAKRAGLPFAAVRDAARILERAELLAREDAAAQAAPARTDECAS